MWAHQQIYHSCDLLIPAADRGYEEEQRRDARLRAAVFEHVNEFSR